MQKVPQPHRAVLDYNKVEQSFTRAARYYMSPATHAWWLMYYKQRTAQIAAHYKMDEDELVTEWLKWRTEVRAQA